MLYESSFIILSSKNVIVGSEGRRTEVADSLNEHYSVSRSMHPASDFSPHFISAASSLPPHFIPTGVKDLTNRHIWAAE